MIKKNLISKKTIVYVVPHTHWESESYFNANSSILLLTKNLTFLIDVLEKDKTFKYFHYDGQLSLIEDYLKYNPQNIKRIKKLIKQKRLFIGPWYIQPDLNLTSAESIIRNLQYGISISESFGHSMKVGYLPDSFGSNNQIPQILKGFEIDNIIFRHGIDLKDVNNNIYFNWKSPNGDEILSIFLRYGYNAGADLSDLDEKLFGKTFPKIVEMKKMTNTNLILLPSGGDYSSVNINLPKIIKAISLKDNQNEYILSNYEDFISDLKKKINPKEIPIYHSILRSSMFTKIYKTIGSIRMDIKQKIFKLESILINKLEPLLVFAKTNGIEYNELLLEDIWKKLLSTQSQSSYSIFNSDEINKEIDQKVSATLDLVKSLIALTCKQLLNNLKNMPSNFLFIYNQKINITKQFVTTIVSSEFENISLFNNNQKINPFILEKTKILNSKDQILDPNDDKQNSQSSYFIYKIFFEIEIKSNDFMIFEIIENKVPLIKQNLEKKIISNENFIFEIKDNEIKLKTLLDNKTYDKFLQLQIEYEDGYQSDFLQNLTLKKIENFSEIKMISIFENKNLPSLSFIGVVHIPKDSKSWLKNDNNLKQEVLFTVSLLEKKLDIKIKVINKTCDTKIKLFLNGLDSNDHIYQYDNTSNLVEETGFYISNWKERKFKENPILVNNQHNFIKLNSKINLITTYGTKEHEFIKDKGLYITLFKTFNAFDKNDLENKLNKALSSNESISLVSEGQMYQKELNFSIGIYYQEKINPFIKAQEEINFINYNKQQWNKYTSKVEIFDFDLKSKFDLISKTIPIEIIDKNTFVVLSNYIFKGKTRLRILNATSRITHLKLNTKIKFQRINLLGKKELKSLLKVNPFEIITLEY